MGRMRRKTYKSYANRRSFFSELMSPIYDLLNRLMDGLIGLYIACVGFGILLLVLNYKYILQWLNANWFNILSYVSILIIVVIGIVFLFRKLKTKNRR